MTQKERQERSKEEIYQAALEEFGTYGYGHVNMEQICGRHSISKGMMYHYYSSKDELFLLCVDRTFSQLLAYIERDLGELKGHNALETIKDYFMIREYFFQLHPKQKLIFEDAMLHTPKQLAEQIQELHEPLQELNRKFLGQLVAQAPLRPGLDRGKVVSYLESVGASLQNNIAFYQGQEGLADLHSMLKTAGEILDMLLYGVFQQTSEPSVPA